MADQTFGFMDGSQYNANGQQISGATGGAPVIPPTIPNGTSTTPTSQSSSTVPVTVNPTTQIPSSSLSNPTTNMDWMALLQKNLSQQDSLINGVTGAMTPTQQELDYQKQLDDSINSLNNFDVSVEGGLQNIMKKPIALEFQQGQQAALTRDASFTRSSLARQVDAYTRTLQSAQATRQQKLDAAKFLYDSNRNNLADTITLMKATAPENIGNVVDPQTGEMTVIMKNPVTGEVSRNNLGVVQTPERVIANVKFAQTSGVTKPFYMRDGRTVINTQNGREYSSIEQAAADGVDTKGWGNVQVIAPRPDYSGLPASAAEYEYAKSQGYKGSYSDYQNDDANRKIRIGRGTSGGGGDPLTGHGSTKEFNRVKQIIAMHPNEWGDAADQIDREFGKDTATFYDSLLQSEYAPKDSLDPSVQAWLGL